MSFSQHLSIVERHRQAERRLRSQASYTAPATAMPVESPTMPHIPPETTVTAASGVQAVLASLLGAPRPEIASYLLKLHQTPKHYPVTLLIVPNFAA
jgi:hypothetical protein